MKRILFCLGFFLVFSAVCPAADGEDNWDLDSMFDEEAAENADAGGGGEEEPLNQNTIFPSGENILSGLLRRRGFSLEADYFFYGGFSPGWSQAPWHWEGSDEEYSHILGGEMKAGIGLDVQLSQSLRVKASVAFVIPAVELYIRDFFLDYNLRDLLFLRAGKYYYNWGISPNYPFTNLLSRIPAGNSGGDSYILKANVPIGIGGIEALALTRSGFMADPGKPNFSDLGYGGKYNLALRWADFDLGGFYHDKMPLRFFLSVKSTIFNTEVYSEAMVSSEHDPWGNIRGSANIGLIKALFLNKLTVNGEFFYNGEKDAFWFSPKGSLDDEKTSPFIEGFNLAFNVLFRPGGLLGLRVYTQCLYNINENTVQLVPGVSIDPFSHVRVSLAVPMALGSQAGTYYRFNADKDNRPFSIVFLVSISGDYRYGKYE
jgi:hypothetical protein